jgi:MFS family permease
MHERLFGGGVKLGAPRTLLFVVALEAVASGVYLTSGILYFSRIVHVTSTEVGWGFSAAGVMCVGACVAAGRASDRFGPVRTLRWCLAGAAVAMFAVPAVRSANEFLVLAPLASAAHASIQVAVASTANRLVRENANEFRGYVRAMLNVGYAAGAALSGVAAQRDSILIYHLLFIYTAVSSIAACALTTALPSLPATSAAQSSRTWQTLRDRPYLVLTAVDGLLSLQYRMQSVVLPLWIITMTLAPRWTIAAVDVTNTVIIVAFQVRVCRGIDSPASSARALRRCGWVFAAACLVIPESARSSPVFAVFLLLIATLALSVGELWQSAAGFELSNSLAAPGAVGEYLGVFGTGLRFAEAAGPALLTWLCIGFGRAGWYAVGLLLLATGLISPTVTRWVQRTRPDGPVGLFRNDSQPKAGMQRNGRRAGCARRPFLTSRP